MTPIRMKPETIARRAAQHQEERQSRRASLIARLTDAAAQHGPDSIYAEMLAETLQANA